MAHLRHDLAEHEQTLRELAEEARRFTERHARQAGKSPRRRRAGPGQNDFRF